jgi:hypothetical protein
MSQTQRLGSEDASGVLRWDRQKESFAGSPKSPEVVNGKIFFEKKMAFEGSYLPCYVFQQT